MKERILTVLVVVSLVLSVFSLVLTFRSNGTNAITNLVGQSSSVTWKKVELYYTLISNYAYPEYAVSVYESQNLYALLVPMWNVTMTLQWTNGTVQYFSIGQPFLYGGGTEGIGEGVTLPLGLLYGGVPRDSWNVTSITAYILEPPQ